MPGWEAGGYDAAEPAKAIMPAPEIIIDVIAAEKRLQQKFRDAERQKHRKARNAQHADQRRKRALARHIRAAPQQAESRNRHDDQYEMQRNFEKNAVADMPAEEARNRAVDSSHQEKARRRGRQKSHQPALQDGFHARPDGVAASANSPSIAGWYCFRKSAAQLFISPPAMAFLSPAIRSW